MAFLEGMFRKAFPEQMAGRDTRMAQLEQQKREAEVGTGLAGLKGLADRATLEGSIARSDLGKEETRLERGRLGQKDQIEQLRLKTDEQKAKLGQLVGEEALEAYEAGEESRKLYLDKMKDVDKRRAEVVKQAWDKFDSDNALSRIAEKFALPIEAAINILNYFRRSGNEEQATKQFEKYVSEEMEKPESRLQSLRTMMGE